MPCLFVKKLCLLDPLAKVCSAQLSKDRKELTVALENPNWNADNEAVQLLWGMLNQHRLRLAKKEIVNSNLFQNDGSSSFSVSFQGPKEVLKREFKAISAFAAANASGAVSRNQILRKGVAKLYDGKSLEEHVQKWRRDVRGE